MAEFSELEILRTLETSERSLPCEYYASEIEAKRKSHQFYGAKRNKIRHFETVIPKRTFTEKSFYR